MKNNMLDRTGSKTPFEVVPPAIDGVGSVPALVDCLKMLPPGPIQNTVPVIRMLVEAWNHLEGSDNGGMRCDKLLGGRCEDLSWDPPLLSFVIERHAATINGSSRAELQYWNIDPVASQAWISKKGQRQLYPMSKRLDVAPLAESVSVEIENRSKSNRLKWHPDGSARVLVSQIIPETNAQTTESRRKRFRAALVGAMASKGWQEIKLHTYQKMDES